MSFAVSLGLKSQILPCGTLKKWFSHTGLHFLTFHVRITIVLLSEYFGLFRGWELGNSWGFQKLKSQTNLEFTTFLFVSQQSSYIYPREINFTKNKWVKQSLTFCLQTQPLMYPHPLPCHLSQLFLNSCKSCKLWWPTQYISFPSRGQCSLSFNVKKNTVIVSTIEVEQKFCYVTSKPVPCTSA